MMARYYSSSLGRFMAVDPATYSSSVADPQSWNRYIYANNNPLGFVDPRGTDPRNIYCMAGLCGGGGGPIGAMVSSGGASQNSEARSAARNAQGMSYPVGECLLPVESVVVVASAPNPLLVFLYDLLDDYRHSYDPGIAIGMSHAIEAGGGAIRVTAKAIKHILDRHSVQGARAVGKSLFAAGEDVAALAKAAEAVHVIRTPIIPPYRTFIFPLFQVRRDAPGGVHAGAGWFA